MFYDDILIYSPKLAAHKQHVETALKILQQHQLYVKWSKCAFGQTRIEYLGHIITGEGVAADHSKVACMLSWPMPNYVKSLRGFLGLTGYYRRFVKNYGLISRPLTELLKKGKFMWNEAANEAFNILNVAMSSAPVLALPDFKLPLHLRLMPLMLALVLY